MTIFQNGVLVNYGKFPCKFPCKFPSKFVTSKVDTFITEKFLEISNFQKFLLGHREKILPNKTQTLTKSMNIDTWVIR